MSEVAQAAGENITAETEVAETADKTEVAELSEVEQRARRMNWKPKDEYLAAGKDEASWVDAEAYVNKIEADLPALRERNKKLVKTVDKLEKGMEEGNKLLRDLVEHQGERERKAVEKALKEAEAQRRDAISIGDVEAAERLSDEISDHKEALKKPVKVEKQNHDQDKPDVPQEVIDWVEVNPWFNTDRAMHALATAHFGELMADKSLTDTQRLAKVKAEVVRRFPEKFGNPKRAAPPAVETGDGASRNRNAAKGWNDLPAGDREIAERLIKQGAVKSKDAYLKSYRW